MYVHLSDMTINRAHVSKSRNITKSFGSVQVYENETKIGDAKNNPYNQHTSEDYLNILIYDLEHKVQA